MPPKYSVYAGFRQIRYRPRDQNRKRVFHERSFLVFDISFVNDSKKLRMAQHCYLNALIDNAIGIESSEKMQKSVRLNNDNFFVLFFEKFVFLHLKHSSANACLIIHLAFDKK